MRLLGMFVDALSVVHGCALGLFPRHLDQSESSQAWTIRDWQHQGYQRILSRLESFSTHHGPDPSLADVQHPDIIRVEEMFTYAPPISDGDRPTALQLPPVFYGGTRLAHLGDLSSPSSERPRAERAVSRSPRRSGYFGRR